MTFAMKKTIYIAALLLGVGLLCSCENSVEQPAKDVLAVVQSEYEAGNYNKAKALIDKGGVIGLNLYRAIINEDKEKRDIPDFFKHLDYCLENFGENGIGFGGDIDGTTGRFPRDLDLSRSIHDQLIEYLQKHYDERIVEKVAGGNYLNFLKNNL